MGVYNFAGYKIITAGTRVNTTNKTLVISCHGAILGQRFSRPYPTVVQFCTPKQTALLAALLDVINEKVEAVELATGTQTELDDYYLSWFEHDPDDAAIEGALAANPRDWCDVMVFNQGDTMEITLSRVLRFLKFRGYLYPSILCVFCRVSQQQFVSGQYIGQDFQGKLNPYVARQNAHKVNMTAIALELMQRGWKR
jgi:hypothetical protein